MHIFIKMKWRDIRKEFGNGIDKVDKLDYDKIYLLGILTDKYNSEKMTLNFVICKSEQYQKDLEQRYMEKNKDKLLWTIGMNLIRK